MIKKFHEAELDEVFLSNSRVFTGKLLQVEKDEVRLPNGSTATREYIRHPGAVGIVPILEDGRIVLVKQCRYALGTVMWEIPAGKLDHGAEDPLDCAMRELSVETGYEAEQWTHLVDIATTPGFTDEVIHLYRAEGLSLHEQHPDEDEFVTMQAFTREELLRMLQQGELFDAKTLCAFFALHLVK